MTKSKISIIELMERMDFSKSEIEEWKTLIEKEQQRMNTKSKIWRRENTVRYKSYEVIDNTRRDIIRNPKIAFDFFDGIFFIPHGVGSGWTYFDSISKTGRCRSCNKIVGTKPLSSCEFSEHTNYYEKIKESKHKAYVEKKMGDNK